jgi:excisionase family DNA binding protein
MVNAKYTPTKSVVIVNTNCPYLIACCNGEVLKPLPGARFERVCSIDEFEKWADSEPLISVEEAARRIGYKRKTIYCWIEKGRLGREQGLRSVGNRHRIDWWTFREAVSNGGFGPCS